MAGHAQAPPDVSPRPDEPVRIAVMEQSWEQLTFLHWPYDPATIQALLPRGLGVDTFGGTAWVGLTPFMAAVRPPHFAALSVTFPETNVRTYVRGPDGRRGVWFFSLDAGKRLPAAAARALYRLPYQFARMSVDWAEGRVRYQSWRLWPEPGPASDIEIEPHEPFAPAELGPRDHFLTARWRLFARIKPGELAVANVEHPPWPLARARAVSVRENLVVAAGLPPPAGEPLIHYSPGVQVRVGPLIRL
jgi:uncharacterized protein YqjF (DUF2071 family)